MNRVFTKHLVLPGDLKTKVIFKGFIISLLLISLLCSCNKNDNNVSDDTAIDTVSQSDKSNENDTKNSDNILQTNVDKDKALIKVQEEVEALTGLINVEVSELFNIENIHYIKVKIPNLMLEADYVQVGDDNYIETLEYTDTYENGMEKYTGDFYEVWRYESDTPRRVLYNMTDVVYSKDNDKIFIDGEYNSYIIKLDSDHKGKQMVLYECYYTDILNSDNGDFTCYINDFYSACVVNNKNNEVILNKYIDVDSEFSEEDFILDNNKAFFPKRMWVTETGWIKNSNIAYFLCYDCVNTYITIDIDKEIVFNPCSSYEGYIDKDNGYVISGNTSCGVRMDADIYMEEEMKKQNHYLYLTNLFTLEKSDIAKSIKSSIEPKREDDRNISYKTSSGERATIDISDMLGKNRSNIRDGFKDMLNSKLNLNGNDLDEIELKQLIISNDKYYQTVKKNADNSNYKYQLIKCYNNSYTVLIEGANNIQLYKFKDDVHAYVEDGENTRLIQYTEDNTENIIIGEFDDINFSELNRYISMYNNNGDIIVLDSDGNKYFDGNVFNDASNNVNSSGNNDNDKTNIELGVTSWDKNNDKLYILTKKDDRLSNIFEVNLIDKSIRDLALNIDCRYENMYIDISKGYVIYSTFPGSIFSSYEEEFKDDVYLYFKYFNSDEIIEIAHIKGESIYYYIHNNQLDYYYRKNNENINGTYIIE